MNDDAKNYLYFSKVERNGMLFLFMLLAAFLLFPLFYSHKMNSGTSDFSEFKAEIANFEITKGTEGYVTDEAKTTVVKKKVAKEGGIEKKTLKPALALFRFDPNTVSKGDLLNLGFPEKVALRLIKYRATGAVFYTKEDVAKVYGLEQELLRKLEPYMAFSSKKAKVKTNDKQKGVFGKTKNVTPSLPKKELPNIAINKANAEDWESIYGIGPVLAERIVKFRDKLGGFHSIEQVGEVYGVPDSTFSTMKQQLVLDDAKIVKIDINNATKEELAAHPYLKWKQAKIIINYREQHGPYSSKEDLLKLRGIPEEQLEKILRYVEFITN